jgi:hypothetical protein
MIGVNTTALDTSTLATCPSLAKFSGMHATGACRRSPSDVNLGESGNIARCPVSAFIKHGRVWSCLLNI